MQYTADDFLVAFKTYCKAHKKRWRKNYYKRVAEVLRDKPLRASLVAHPPFKLHLCQARLERLRTRLL
jgi:ADP-heptose:LPS heptosyltransferase